jgi:hypothetical protein
VTQRVCLRWCFADAGLKSGAYIAAYRSGSAGRHPCSTAWRDVRGLRSAMLHLNFVSLKLKTLRLRDVGAGL